MNLLNLRKRLGLTQQQVADALGINVVTYYGYEKERSDPSLKMLIRLADFYNVSLDYLCGYQTQSGLFGNLNDQQLNIVKNLENLNDEQLKIIQNLNNFSNKQLQIIEILENFSNEQVDAVLNLNKLNYKNFVQIANNIQFLLSEQEKPQ